MPVLTAVQFYRDHYPWQALVAFLTRHGDALSKREFAVEGDYYRRYVVAKDADELKREVLAMRGLASFHIGPVYNERVVRSAAQAYMHSWPVRRELVFDLDLTDYDFLELETPEGDVDADACDKAWCVCAVGIFILQRLLKNAFGFQEFVVVYSGRRGAHLYVCDDKAMGLPDDVRAAITDFFKFVPSEDGQRAHSSTRSVMVMHELSEALHYIFEEHFIDELGLFETQDQRVNFVDRLGFSEELVPSVASLAVDVLDESMTGRAMWEFLKAKVASLPQEWMRHRIDDMMLTYVWPRIDAGVSRHLNHLLKAPFVAHPKTGRVAVPVNAVDYFRFAPCKVPALDTVLDVQPFAEHESVRWLAPCHVAEPDEKGKKGDKKKKGPKGKRKKAVAAVATAATAAVAQDVDMEDLAGAAPAPTPPAPPSPSRRRRRPSSPPQQQTPRQCTKRARAFVRKPSPLASQVHTAPPVVQKVEG